MAPRWSPTSSIATGRPASPSSSSSTSRAKDRSRCHTPRSPTSSLPARTRRLATASRPGWNAKRRRGPGRPTFPLPGALNPLLVLTAIELEARALARRLELPRLTHFPFLAFGRGSVRLAPVGIGAGLCRARWARLLEGLGCPLVISAGVCGGLDPRLAPGDLVIPGRVTGPDG